jgi:hypothetical protein
MSEPKRAPRRPQSNKKVIYLTGKLACSLCPQQWNVVDLNPERKAVPCPTCGTVNDIREAIKRAL